MQTMEGSCDEGCNTFNAAHLHEVNVVHAVQVVAREDDHVLHVLILPVLLPHTAPERPVSQWQETRHGVPYSTP